MVVACSASPALICSASLYGEGDLTATATWSGADSFRLGTDVPPTQGMDGGRVNSPQLLHVTNVQLNPDNIDKAFKK